MSTPRKQQRNQRVTAPEAAPEEKFETYGEESHDLRYGLNAPFASPPQAFANGLIDAGRDHHGAPWIDKLGPDTAGRSPIAADGTKPTSPDARKLTIARLLDGLAPAVPVRQSPLQAQAMPSKEPPAASSIQEAWLTIERNTMAMLEEWDFIDAREGAAYPGEAAEDRTGDPVDLYARYMDVGCVRHSAILNPVSGPDGGAHPRYLHANRMDLKWGRRLIAAQKPVAAELAGFHQTLFDADVSLIVDLSRHLERESHALYAPDQDGRAIRAIGSELIVSCSAVAELPRLKATCQQLTVATGAAMKRLQRLHFPHWPDHAAIEVESLILLADTVESLSARRPGAVLIHCVAGVGRTGTLMAFLAARQRMLGQHKAGASQCPPQTILRIAAEVVAQGRIDRGPWFVQTAEQFQLLVSALMAADRIAPPAGPNRGPHDRERATPTTPGSSSSSVNPAAAGSLSGPPLPGRTSFWQGMAKRFMQWRHGTGGRRGG